MEKQGRLTLDVRLHGQKHGEETPKIAAYLLDAAGRVEHKIGTAVEGKINLAFDPDKDNNRIIAFGPDVEDLSSLRKSTLLQFRVSDQLPIWEKEKYIEFLRPWWVDWILFRVCVSGRVRKCFPILFNNVASLALTPMLPYIPFPPYPRYCRPICNGVVEVYERNCCCRPWLTIDLSEILKRLKQFVDGPGHVGPGDPVENIGSILENPGAIRGFNPQPEPPGSIRGFNPQPDPPGAVFNRVSLRSLKRAEAFDEPQPIAEDVTKVALDIKAIEFLARPEAIKYIEARPYLWPFWCTCTTTKIGEAILRPDGSFQFCHRHFPFLRLNCTTTYGYKVKQWQNNQWVYVYDGISRHQYYFADQFADLTTVLGRACGQGDGGYSNDRPFVNLQDIGSTRSYLLNSHYQGQSAGGIDLTQISDDAVAAPPVSGGLANPSSVNGKGLLVNQPWGADLSFRLYFDEGMKALGARYYRISVIKAQPNGQPVAGSPTILTNGISWQKYVHVGSHVEIQVDGLGPNPVGSEAGLYKIPFDSDAQWLDGQYHQYWDTTLKDNSNNFLFSGLCLVSIEIFDAAGHRMTPASNGFDYLRLMSASGPGSTAKVNYAKLQHLFWIDNRPVYADIEDLRMNGVPSGAECQFMTGTAGSTFSAGFRAFHATRNSNTPPETFLYYYTIWYHRGLNGPNVTIETGGANQPSTLLGGPPATSTAQTFAAMLGTNAHGAKCTFALNLWAYAKHTNGSRRLSEYDRSDQAAFALEIA
jgi:hypothetical protein